MTKAQSAEFDRQPSGRRWRYNPAADEFRSATDRLDWEDVIGFVPNLSLDDLVA